MLDANCLPLISFESRKRKKKLNFEVQGAFCTKMLNFKEIFAHNRKKKIHIFLTEGAN